MFIIGLFLILHAFTFDHYAFFLLNVLLNINKENKTCKISHNYLLCYLDCLDVSQSKEVT